MTIFIKCFRFQIARIEIIIIIVIVTGPNFIWVAVTYISKIGHKIIRSFIYWIIFFRVNITCYLLTFVYFNKINASLHRSLLIMFYFIFCIITFIDYYSSTLFIACVIFFEG